MGRSYLNLNQKGFEIVEHLDNTEIEKLFLLNENQTLLGHIIATFRFVLAKPV